MNSPTANLTELQIINLNTVDDEIEIQKARRQKLLTTYSDFYMTRHKCDDILDYDFKAGLVCGGSG